MPWNSARFGAGSNLKSSTALCIPTERPRNDAGYRRCCGAEHDGVQLWSCRRTGRPETGHARIDDEPRQIPIPVIFDVPAPCTLSFASNIDMEFFEPMLVGDTITRTSRLAEY